MVKAVNALTLHGQSIGDGITMSEWTFDLTTDNGPVLWNDVLRRRWQNGKVISERYLHRRTKLNPISLAAALAAGILVASLVPGAYGAVNRVGLGGAGFLQSAQLDPGAVRTPAGLWKLPFEPGRMAMVQPRRPPRPGCCGKKSAKLASHPPSPSLTKSIAHL